MLTVERAETLTNFLKSDPARTEMLFGLESEEALKSINANGFDFTIDELNEYCAEFKKVMVQGEGELDEAQLENVAGGLVLTGAMVVGLAACFVGGTAIGVVAGARWKW